MSSLLPLTFPSVDIYAENFSLRLSKCINSVAPLKTKTVSGTTKTPWRHSTPIVKLRRDSRRAERQWKCTKLTVHHDIYKTHLKMLNNTMRSARKAYFSSLIDCNKDNLRYLFFTIDRLLNPSIELSSELLTSAKCNEFAEFFYDKITCIRKNTASTCPLCKVYNPPASPLQCNLSSFLAVSPSTLIQVISHLNSSTCALDPLPTKFLKTVVNCLLSDILNIINQSLQQGVFPQIFKTAIVRPLLKKSNLDTSVLGNYRPISNLPFLGKIIEKIVFIQLNNYFNANSLIETFQSGFRANHSTETALIMNEAFI